MLAAVAAMLDLRKRYFPSRNVKQLYGALILFPPLLGTVIYYFLVIRRRRFESPSGK